MKYSSAFLLICLLFSDASCKRDSPVKSNNEFKATVSIAGNPEIIINATGGKYTMFSRYIRPNGDTFYSVVGGDDLHVVEIGLNKVSGTGTYKFSIDSATGFGSYCTYVFGNPLHPLEFYTTGTLDSTGAITITNLTATHIEGSMTTATCRNDTGEVQVKNVTFKGDF